MRATVLRRRFAVGTLLAAMATAGACGGGGGGGGASGPVPLSGKLTLRDGSDTNLGGVQVLLLGTGQSVTTDAAGSFAFSCASGSDVGLQFVDPLSPAAVRVGSGNLPACALPPDGAGVSFPHTEEMEGDSIRLFQIDEPIEVHVTLDRGLVDSLRTTRGADTSSPDDRGVEPMETVDGSDATGTLTLAHVRGGGFQLRLEAFGLTPSVEYEISLEPPLGHGWTSAAPTNDCGATRQVLVFGSDGVAEDDPTGWTIRVRLPRGADVLVGTVPVAGCEIVP